MTAKIINGLQIAEHAREQVRMDAGRLIQQGITPSLAVVIVGEDPASHSYIKAKKKACAAVGIETADTHFDAAVSEHELLNHIEKLNHTPHIDGVLVQLPLPPHINEHAVLCTIDPQKDVDGFHPHNMGLLALGRPRFEPCTPRGIVHMLGACGAQLPSSETVIVGRSNIVGKPLALMLMRKAKTGDATVTVCHSRTADIAAHTRRANILIAAIGRAGTITAEMVRPGAIVIDVGVNRITDTTRKSGYRLCGDVRFDEVAEVASMITPVPGGVGPMTIAMLLQNTVEAARQRRGGHERT